MLLLNFGATDRNWTHPQYSASRFFYQSFVINPLIEAKIEYKQQTIKYHDLLSKIHEPDHTLKREAFRQAIENSYYTLVKLFVRNGMQVTSDDLLFAKNQYQYAKNRNKSDYRAIGHFLFAYLQLFGTHCTRNITTHLPSSVHNLLSRISSCRSTSDKSLIGPIAKQGIIGTNNFTEDIVRNIARYL